MITQEMSASDNEETSSWMGTFQAMWTSVSSAFSSRHSSSIDTTPPHDLEQFQTAAATLTGLPHIPWRESTAYTEMSICRQLESWDCGVACLQMILAWLRSDTIVNSVEERQWMLETLGTQSVWTIDLFLLLDTMCFRDSRVTASYFLCSKTLGVNRQHNSLHYYEKAFSGDQVRVEDLFAKADKLGLNLLCLAHLGLYQVMCLVALDNVVAIVLLDNSILRNRGNTYGGHYVVLCGMSCDSSHVQEAKRNDPSSIDDYCVVVKNPASEKETDYVTPFLLNKAWRSKGTDDDIIFVAKRDNNDC